VRVMIRAGFLRKMSTEVIASELERARLALMAVQWVDDGCERHVADAEAALRDARARWNVGDPTDDAERLWKTKEAAVLADEMAEGMADMMRAVQASVGPFGSTFSCAMV